MILMILMILDMMMMMMESKKHMKINKRRYVSFFIYGINRDIKYGKIIETKQDRK